jgi:hypothetical protein
MENARATPADRLTPLRIGIVVLALATAAIHVVLATEDPVALFPFFLNGLGYVTLATALVVPRLRAQRHLIRWALMGFTALTIVLWVFLGRPYTTIGYVTKAIEVALLVLLWLDGRKSAE